MMTAAIWMHFIWKTMDRSSHNYDEDLSANPKWSQHKNYKCRSQTIVTLSAKMQRCNTCFWMFGWQCWPVVHSAVLAACFSPPVEALEWDVWWGYNQFLVVTFLIYTSQMSPILRISHIRTADITLKLPSSIYASQKLLILMLKTNRRRTPQS